MEIEGSHRFSLKPERIWELLRDPLILQQAMPAFTQIKKQEDEERWEISFKIDANQIKMRYQNALLGIYRGEARVRDEQWPKSFRLQITGAGTPGSAAADGWINFSEDEKGTIIEYRGDVRVQGGFLGLGGKIMGASMKMLMSQFFQGFDEVLRSKIEK